MAGAGYKLFNTGDVLTAAQVNTYLNEQTVMVFASSTARTTALSGVLAEGMMSYLQDTNAVEVYNGTSWVNVGNAGDLTEIVAGTGITVTSGTGPIPTVALTTPVAATNGGTGQTTYTTGDLIYSSATNTLAKRAIGSTGDVLTVAGGVPTWAAPAGGGGMTLISTTTLSGTTTSITVASNSYKDLVLVFRDAAQTGNTNLGIRINNIDSADTYLNRVSGSTNGSAFNYSTKNTFMVLNAAGVDGYGTNVINGSVTFFDANSTKNKLIFGVVAGKTSANAWGNIMNSTAAVETSAVISDIDVCSFDTFTLSGTALLYGVS